MTARTTTRVWALGGPLGVVANALLLLSLLAFVGEWWWVFDIIANFRVQLALLGVGVILGGVALRTGAVAAVGLVLAVVNLIPVLPLYLSGDAIDAEPDLRVATYNLRLGAAGDPAEVIDWLEDLDADVVFLQEAGDTWLRLVERSDLDLRIVEPRVPFRQRFGTMALVPADSEVEFVELTRRATPAVHLRVDGVDVTVLGVHTISPYRGDLARLRDSELVTIGEWAAQQSGEVVVAGDFNATPFAWAFQRLLEVGGLENSQTGFGLQTTWPTTNVLMRIPIDHVVHSEGLAVIDRRVDGPLGSDHLPVVVDLAVRNGPAEARSDRR